MRVIDKEDLRKRFNHFTAIARLMCDGIENEQNKKFRVNEHSMYLAVKSTYDDIYRYKHYHHDEASNRKSNSVKRAAYLTKWINRCKPLEFIESPELVNDEFDVIGSIVNSTLALKIANAEIGAELSLDFELSEEKEINFIYDLIYRELSGDALLHIFQDIFDVLKPGGAIINLIVVPDDSSK